MTGIRSLRAIDRTQIATFGGKNANLGEMLHLTTMGVRVPDGFALDAEAGATPWF